MPLNESAQGLARRQFIIHHHTPNLHLRIVHHTFALRLKTNVTAITPPIGFTSEMP
jgi:hypothetical protein